jgi:hypothetical protein
MSVKEKTSIIIALFIIIIFSAGPVSAQCSDAGICIFGKKHEETNQKHNSQISLAYVFGRSGESVYDNDDIIYNTFKLGGEFEVFKTSRFGFSIPYSYNSGDFGSVSGIGDLSLYWSYSLPIRKNHLLNFQVGTKLATGKVNSSDSLPQRYMPGLGTNDLLLGVSYSTKNFTISAAYQKPFGRSSNDVTRLKRGDDFLFRAGYHEVFNKLQVKAEVLTILRLQESSILNPLTNTEDFIQVDGSNETQINLLGEVTYSVSDNFDLIGSAAIPLLKRDYNLDGLRRSITLSAGAAYKFSFD